MHPTLFSLGPVRVDAYPFMLALGFATGTVVAVFRGRKRGLDTEIVHTLSLLILASSLLGARLLHFAFHYDLYARSGAPLARLLRLNAGGLMVMGGVAGALSASLLYLWLKRLPVLKITDILAPSVPLGSALVRVGCFLNGCCFGKPTASWTGTTFPPQSPVYRTEVTGILPGTPVWPTQLFESAAGLAMFSLLILAERFPGRFHGRTTGLMLVLFGTWRCFIEELRFSGTDFLFENGGWSVNQVVSMIVVLAGGLVLVAGYRKR